MRVRSNVFASFALETGLLPLPRTRTCKDRSRTGTGPIEDRTTGPGPGPEIFGQRTGPANTIATNDAHIALHVSLKAMVLDLVKWDHSDPLATSMNDLRIAGTHYTYPAAYHLPDRLFRLG